jgi:hypothetical protein
MPSQHGASVCINCGETRAGHTADFTETSDEIDSVANALGRDDLTIELGTPARRPSRVVVDRSDPKPIGPSHPMEGSADVHGVTPNCKQIGAESVRRRVPGGDTPRP